MAAIDANGPFQINGSKKVMALLDDMLGAFVNDGRMKLKQKSYIPCYKIAN